MRGLALSRAATFAVLAIGLIVSFFVIVVTSVVRGRGHTDEAVCTCKASSCATGSELPYRNSTSWRIVCTGITEVSAVKTAGSQVINLKLANNITVKATVLPAASVRSASSTIIKAANAI
ncbi:hypothetical protein H8958_006806 [Nasalis larvatus]